MLQALDEVTRYGSMGMVVAAFLMFCFWAGWAATSKHGHPAREALSLTMNCLVWGMTISLSVGFLLEMTTGLLSNHDSIVKPLSFTAVIVVAGTAASRLANKGPLSGRFYSPPDSDDE